MVKLLGSIRGITVKKAPPPNKNFSLIGGGAFLVVNFGPNFVSAVEAQTPIITGFRVSSPPQAENLAVLHF